MKKLIFLAAFGFLFFSNAQGRISPADNLISIEEGDCLSSQISIEFRTDNSLGGLVLVGTQKLTFTNASGSSILVDLVVNNYSSSSATLQVDFSASVNLNTWIATSAQQLGFVDQGTGMSVSVDFIIVEQIIH